MGKNKDLRTKIAGIRRKIAEHQDKVRTEKMKPDPDDGQIAHWEHEIEAHEKRLRILMRRLQREW